MIEYSVGFFYLATNGKVKCLCCMSQEGNYPFGHICFPFLFFPFIFFSPFEPFNDPGVVVLLQRRCSGPPQSSVSQPPGLHPSGGLQSWRHDLSRLWPCCRSVPTLLTPVLLLFCNLCLDFPIALPLQSVERDQGQIVKYIRVWRSQLLQCSSLGLSLLVVYGQAVRGHFPHSSVTAPLPPGASFLLSSQCRARGQSPAFISSDLWG